MNILALIPARMGSSRFPGKPLSKILGKPMIEHVFRRVKKCSIVTKTVVATCDPEIDDYIKSIGGDTVMTSQDHERASERCAEAHELIENRDKIKYDIVVMIQGDEPLVDPKDIDRVINFHLKNNKFDIVVPCMQADENFASRNLVKVIFSDSGRILYFSRAVVPFNFKNKKIKYYRDLSIVSFIPKILIKYSKLKMGFLENVEGIELIRALENNISIGTFIAKNSGFAVDVNQDLMRAINVMPTDSIRKKY